MSRRCGKYERYDPKVGADMTTLPVLIDVDGVLADFVTPLLKACGSSLTLEQITEYEFFTHHMSQDQRARAFEVCDTPQFWADLPVISGAQVAVEHIRAKYPVVFLTQPWSGCRQWHKVRLAWLGRHFGATHREFVPLHGSLKHLVDGLVLIEDSPANLEAWARHHPDRLSVIFNQPWNRRLVQVSEDKSTLWRVGDWSGTDFLLERLAMARDSR